MLKIRIIIILLVLSFLGACGGSNVLPQSSVPAPTLTIEGSVASPEAVSSNLTATLTRKLESTNAPSIICTLYNLNGDLLSSVTTDTNGEYLAEVEIDTLKGAANSGTSWSQNVILDCENGIQSFSEVSVDESLTTSLDLGAADAETSLLAIQWASQLDGFSGWGNDYTASPLTAQLDCFQKAGRSVFDNAAIDDGFLYDDIAIIKSVFEGLIASGVNPDQLGYESWALLIKDILGGSLSTDIWEDMISIASLADDSIDDDVYLTAYSQAALALNSIADLITSHFTQAADDLNQGICNALADGTLDADTFIKPFLSADDVSEFETTLDNENGFSLHLNMMNDCLSSGTCENIKDKASAYFGFLSGYGGDVSGLLDSNGDFAETTLEGILLATQNCFGDTLEALKFCGASMQGTIEAHEGLDGFADNGTYDEKKFEAWSNYWKIQIENGFEPPSNDAAYFEAVKDDVGPTIDNPDDPVHACLDTAVTLDEIQACFINVPFCGDNVCDDFEQNSGSCTLDCGGGAAGDPPADEPVADAPIDFSGFYNNYSLQVQASADTCLVHNIVNLELSNDQSQWVATEDIIGAAGGLQRILTFHDTGNGQCSSTFNDQACSCSYESVLSKLKIAIICEAPANVLGNNVNCSVELRKNL